MRLWKVMSIALVSAASVGCGQDGEAGLVAEDDVLLQPQNETFQATAPDTYHVRFETTAGDFTVEVVRDWAPQGADRFHNLVRNGYYDGVYFFRVIDGFMAQFGLHGDPRVNEAWRDQRIPDDPVRESNRRGMVTFATSGPGSRTTQLFINFADNTQLDGVGFSPIGRVVDGMDVVDALYSGYGEGPPGGTGPNQIRIRAEGNEYLQRDFPNLDQVRRATVVD